MAFTVLCKCSFKTNYYEWILSEVDSPRLLNIAVFRRLFHVLRSNRSINFLLSNFSGFLQLFSPSDLVLECLLLLLDPGNIAYLFFFGLSVPCPYSEELLIELGVFYPDWVGQLVLIRILLSLVTVNLLLMCEGINPKFSLRTLMQNKTTLLSLKYL